MKLSIDITFYLQKLPILTFYTNVFAKEVMFTVVNVLYVLPFTPKFSQF